MMKIKLTHIDGKIFAIKAEDTVTLKEPMDPSKRYIAMQHGKKGATIPYLLPYTPFNALERANLISDVYEILASKVGIGRHLVLNHHDDIATIDFSKEYKASVSGTVLEVGV